MANDEGFLPLCPTRDVYSGGGGNIGALLHSSHSSDGGGSHGCGGGSEAKCGTKPNVRRACFPLLFGVSTVDGFDFDLKRDFWHFFANVLKLDNFIKM